ncbi:unnamed protein product [Enterobius vermicularis]|uniref:Exonuclease domain-containing protein n=1 Tax=Enterobius vermicularis TaxID=51028 RepID=A0A0N4V3K3_ENTVE|nr:unnamed protein product [Enterobius vermicularis]
MCGSKTVHIKTFVFLDFETTGLFPEEPLNPLFFHQKPGDTERNASRLLDNYISTTNPRKAPRITELSLISISRARVEGAIAEIASQYGEEESASFDAPPTCPVVKLPCNVHTRQINPELDEAAWVEYGMRKIGKNALIYSRNDLEEKNKFAVEWEGVKLFLDQLPKPVCVLAHNGIKYDFRVLHAELLRAGLLQSNPFSSDIYFVDSYLMFMDLEKEIHDDLRTLTQIVDWRLVSTSSKDPASINGHYPAPEVNREDSGFNGRNQIFRSLSTTGVDETVKITKATWLEQYSTPKKSMPQCGTSNEQAK